MLGGDKSGETGRFPFSQPAVRGAVERNWRAVGLWGEFWGWRSLWRVGEVGEARDTYGDTGATVCFTLQVTLLY